MLLALRSVLKNVEKSPCLEILQVLHRKITMGRVPVCGRWLPWVGGVFLMAISGTIYLFPVYAQVACACTLLSNTEAHTPNTAATEPC